MGGRDEESKPDFTITLHSFFLEIDESPMNFYPYQIRVFQQHLLQRRKKLIEEGKI